MAESFASIPISMQYVYYEFPYSVVDFPSFSSHRMARSVCRFWVHGQVILCTNSAYYSTKCDDTPIFLDRSVLGTGKIYIITGQANPTLDGRPKKTQKSTIRFSSRSNRWFYARNLIWMNPGGLPVEEHLNHALVSFFILQTINCSFKPQILRMSDGWWLKQRYG